MQNKKIIVFLMCISINSLINTSNKKENKHEHKKNDIEKTNTSFKKKIKKIKKIAGTSIILSWFSYTLYNTIKYNLIKNAIAKQRNEKSENNIINKEALYNKITDKLTLKNIILFAGLWAAKGKIATSAFKFAANNPQGKLAKAIRWSLKPEYMKKIYA
jgi:hypothetical protein